MEDFVAYPSRSRLGLLVLGSVVFVLAGLWMVGAFGAPPSSDRYPRGATLLIGWLAIVFFGGCGVAWLVKLFDTSEQLRIGPHGVRYARWSTATVPWDEITNVTTWAYQRQRSIVLHLRDRDRFPGRGVLGRLATINRGLTGGDIAISLNGTDRGFDEAMAAVRRYWPPE